VLSKASGRRNARDHGQRGRSVVERRPMEVAAVALFLVSDDSSFVTGQVLSPNGGLVT